MGTTLQHGIFLPAEGERNCYAGLASNWTILDGVVGGYSAHAANTTIHVTAEDKTKWDAVDNKADASALTAHTGNTTIHVTAEDKTKWDAVTGKADSSALTAHTGNTTIHVTAADKEAWNGKADSSALTAHTGNTTIHVTAADKEAWNGKADASALTAHTGDTTIHVTAEDKAKWDAVTSKADDADVLHKTGNETKAGNLTVTELNATKINSLNPGALSLPDLTAGVDISGYLSNAGTTTPSEYTPTVDGWLVLAISADSPAFIRVFSSSGIDTTAYSERNELGSTSGGAYTRYAALTVPCRQNDKQNIVIMPSSMGIVKAMFYPCTGNV